MCPLNRGIEWTKSDLVTFFDIAVATHRRVTCALVTNTPLLPWVHADLTDNIDGRTIATDLDAVITIKG